MKLQGRCSEIFLAFKIRKNRKGKNILMNKQLMLTELLVFSLDKKEIRQGINITIAVSNTAMLLVLLFLG